LTGVSWKHNKVETAKKREKETQQKICRKEQPIKKVKSWAKKKTLKTKKM